MSKRTAPEHESEHNLTGEATSAIPGPEQSETSPLPRRVRGEHCVNVFVSHELKQELQTLAEKYDRTMADMVRAVLRIGIPMMTGLSAAEEVMVKEYIQLFRRLRQVKSLKEI